MHSRVIETDVREINLAFERMAAGDYGSCEICEKRIDSKRLKVLPATRLCCKCAQNYEKAQDLRQYLRDEIIDDVKLDEYRNLLDEGILGGMAQLPNDVRNYLNLPTAD